MSLALFHDTIVAAGTPPGRSALAIVRLSGPDAIAIVAKLMDDPAKLLVLRSGGSVHANLTDDSPIDDAVLHVSRAPRSYTGEDTVEITCHGSTVIVDRLIDSARRFGARVAEPGEFSRRAFWNGKITLEEAELIPLKIDAENVAELRGSERGLREKFDVLRRAYDELIQAVALIDAEIDFGESDSIEALGLDKRVAQVRLALEHLLASSSTRAANAGFFTIALIGPPNVGKSSLFNALLRTERSIVSETPGTTRDYLEAFIEIDGFRVKLVDTAGVREAGESIEERGIALGQTAAMQADLVFRLTDPGSRSDPAVSGEILLHNKVDLDHWSDGLTVSALSGRGLSELHAFIAEGLRGYASELSRPRMLEGEKQILQSALGSLEALDLKLELPLLADELRQTADSIGILLGMTTSVESLNYVFSSMCIGK
jgi:tRNA modification GTPase